MQPYGGPPPQKKGLSTLAIVLIIVACLAVLVLGTCAVGVFLVGRAAEKAVAAVADGGALVLVSPPAVKAELAGPKKDYVGSWRSARGSRLTIGADGDMNFEKDEGVGGKENLHAPIAAFAGNDMQIRAVLLITVTVTSPPHNVGDHLEMTADGITFERK